MSSVRTEKLRRELSELRPHQIIKIRVEPPTREEFLECTKIALDAGCFSAAMGSDLIIRKLPPIDDAGYPGLAFAVPIYGDSGKFNDTLASSPTFHDDLNEFFVSHDRPSPREVIEFAVRDSRKEFVVFTHHDVYLPHGWGPRMWRAWQDAERRFGPIGVLGVFGVSGDRRVQRIEAGAVIDQYGARTLVGSQPLPAEVRTLDGCVLMFRRDSGLAPDPDLGWHFYDADMCLKAAERGLKVVAVENWLLHLSEWREPDASFMTSQRIFREKWARALPVEVPCALVS